MTAHREAKSTGEDQKPAWVSLAFQNIFLKRYSRDHWPLQQTAPWWSKRCCCRVLILKKSVSDQMCFCIRNENRTLEEGNERNYLGCIIEKTEGVEGKCWNKEIRKLLTLYCRHAIEIRLACLRAKERMLVCTTLIQKLLEETCFNLRVCACICKVLWRRAACVVENVNNELWFSNLRSWLECKESIFYKDMVWLKPMA